MKRPDLLRHHATLPEPVCPLVARATSLATEMNLGVHEVDPEPVAGSLLGAPRCDVVIGAFYELPDGRITRILGSSNVTGLVRHYFDDGLGGREIPVDETAGWLYQEGMEDFPNARDPRLPYVFDLVWDLKYMSDLRAELVGHDDEDEIRETMANLGIVLADEEQGQAEPALLEGSATASLAFRGWFGDSKVVDHTGAPLVLVHGTPYDFSAFRVGEDGVVWFGGKDSDEVDVAILDEGSRAELAVVDSATPDAIPSFPVGARMIPVYLKIERPYAPAGGFGYPDGATLRAQGYDGAIERDEEGHIVCAVVLSPAQIKSAIGNCGAFDSACAEICR